MQPRPLWPQGQWEARGAAPAGEPPQRRSDRAGR